MKIATCVYCGKLPRVVEITGLFYVQCCDEHNPYDYMGLHPKNAIESWNTANDVARTMRRTKQRNVRIETLKSPWTYVYKGKEYSSMGHVADAVGCSPSTIQIRFARGNNQIMFKDHIITRRKREDDE